MPGELHQAAEAAVRSGRRQHVQFQGTTLTIDTPARHMVKRRRTAAALSPAEREEILRATSGGWKGLVDPEQLRRELNELQRDDSTPPAL